MTPKFTLLLLLLSANSFAAEDWFCSEESSEKRGNSIYACGIGEGPSESDARSSALDNAKLEFSKLCTISDDCRGHRVIARPARTTCEPGYRCYRMVVFTIQSVSADATGGEAGLSIGMTQQAVLTNFGMPKVIGHPPDGTLTFQYYGEMCQRPGCVVYLRDGLVSKYYDFNVLHTGSVY